MRRHIATVAGLGAVAVALTGCAFGDYLAYAPCERYAEQIAAVVENAVGERPEIGDVWADGAGTPLCRLPFTLSGDLTSADPERKAMGDAIDELRATWSDEVTVVVTSGTGETFVFG